MSQSSIQTLKCQMRKFLTSSCCHQGLNWMTHPCLFSAERVAAEAAGCRSIGRFRADSSRRRAWSPCSERLIRFELAR